MRQGLKHNVSVRLCAGLETALKHSLEVGRQVFCQCSKPWLFPQPIASMSLHLLSRCSTRVHPQGHLANLYAGVGQAPGVKKERR